MSPPPLAHTWPASPPKFILCPFRIHSWLSGGQSSVPGGVVRFVEFCRFSPARYRHFGAVWRACHGSVGSTKFSVFGVDGESGRDLVVVGDFGLDDDVGVVAGGVA